MLESLLLLPDSLKDMKELTLTRHTVYVSTVEKSSFVGVAFTNMNSQWKKPYICKQCGKVFLYFSDDQRL
jgi:hypothetical protein